MNPDINIISRFNLPLQFKSELSDRRLIGNPPLGDDWLLRRREFFKSITQASIIKQSYRNFSWFVLFHPETHRDFVKNLGGGFIPVYGDNFSDCLQQIRTLEADMFGEKKQVYVSVRLDTDDAISPDYLHKVSSFFHQGLFLAHHSTRLALVYRRGQYRDLIRDEITDTDYPNNPFSSLGEYVSAREIKTIYCTDHTKLSKIFPTFSMESNDYSNTWTISVHDSNIGNRTPSAPKRRKSLLFKN